MRAVTVGDRARWDLEFVGRGDELMQLGELFSPDAAAAMSRAALVAGEPGIGKTRLVQEAAGRAEAAGWRIVWATCRDEPLTPWLWPWACAVRACLDGRADRAGRWLSGLGSQLSLIVPELAAAEEPPPDIGQDAARFHVFDAVERFCCRVAAETALLIVFDDLQWADVDTVRLMGQLHGLRSVPMVLVGTYRDRELARTHPVAESLTRLGAKAIRMQLEGLGPQDCAALAHQLGTRRHSAVDASRLHERTGGNPLFVRELMGLAAAGDLDAVPETVRSTILMRVGRLSASADAALRAGAVVGESFDTASVTALLDMEAALVLGALEEAADARLLSPSHSAQWRFAHALVREVVYESLADVERRSLHRRYAETLERRAEADAAGSIAMHLNLALPLGDPERAAGWAYRAGRRALDRLAFEEAERHFEAAAAALSSTAGSPVLALEADVGLAEVYRRTGRVARARELCRRAAAGAERVGRPELAAAAALAHVRPSMDLGVPFAGPVDHESVDLVQSALKLLGPGDTPVKVRLLARLAILTYYETASDRTDTFSGEAVAMARRLDDPQVLVEALFTRHNAAAAMTPARQRLELATEMLVAARRTGRRHHLLAAHLAKMLDHLALGDVSAVDGEIAAFRAAAAGTMMPLYEWYLGVWTAMRRLLDGAIDDAAAIAEDTYRAAAPVLRYAALTEWSVFLFWDAWERGRLADLVEPTRTFCERMPHAAPQAYLVVALLAAGERDEAQRLLARLAADRFAAFPRRWLWQAAWFVLSLAAADLGDAAAAEDLHELGQPFADEVVFASAAAACLGSARFALGRLAMRLGRVDEACAHFESALEANTRMGNTLWAARSGLRLADALVQRGADGAIRARTLVEAARRTAERGPFGLLAQEVRAVEDQLGRAAEQPTGRLQRQGATWLVEFAGRTAHVPDSKGMRDIAALVERAGTPIHVLDLIALAEGTAPASAAASTGAGEILDRKALGAYRRRLAELDADIAEAKQDNDAERAARARAEKDFLLDTVQQATGLGGRQRVFTSDVERARKTVRARVRDALRRLAQAQAHPEVASHFEATIATGTRCTYHPEGTVRWEVTSKGPAPAA